MYKNKSSSVNMAAITKARPIPSLRVRKIIGSAEGKLQQLKSVKEETKTGLLEDSRARYVASEAFKSEIARFIEISKYFSSPLHKTASYMCENRLVAYPDPYSIDYKRGSITTEDIKFSNLTLQPVYITLYKVTPDLEQLKFTNLSLSRCKRIPPGLSFNLGLIYDDVNEKPACNAKMVLVASRKTSTPCYQICEIELRIYAQKVRLVTI